MKPLRTICAIALCALSFWAGMHGQRTPKTIEREVFVYINTPVYALPAKTNAHYYGAQRNAIQAVLPASALRPLIKTAGR